jgi:hypothetical protein
MELLRLSSNVNVCAPLPPPRQRLHGVAQVEFLVTVALAGGSFRTTIPPSFSTRNTTLGQSGSPPRVKCSYDVRGLATTNRVRVAAGSIHREVRRLVLCQSNLRSSFSIAPLP